MCQTEPIVRVIKIGYPLLSGVIDIHPVQRIGEAIGITFVKNFTVGNNVYPDLFLDTDGGQSGVTLSFGKKFLGCPPQFLGRNPRREPAGKLLFADQPDRLGVTANERARKNLILIFGLLSKSFLLRLARSSEHFLAGVTLQDCQRIRQVATIPC